MRNTDYRDRNDTAKLERKLMRKIEKSENKLSWSTIKAVIALDGLMHNA